MKYVCCISFILGLSGCTAWPPYNVWSMKLEGEAELQKANFSKQVAVQEAIAKEEAAVHLAKAEVARANGVAQANQIIGSSLKNNEAYLRWLYIEGMKEKTGQEIIYIPTEAGLPILEANQEKIMATVPDMEEVIIFLAKSLGDRIIMLNKVGINKDEDKQFCVLKQYLKYLVESEKEKGGHEII